MKLSSLRHFDTDDDGKVSVEELARILVRMGDSAIPEDDLPLFLQVLTTPPPLQFMPFLSSSMS